MIGSGKVFQQDQKSIDAIGCKRHHIVKLQVRSKVQVQVQAQSMVQVNIVSNSQMKGPGVTL